MERLQTEPARQGRCPYCHDDLTAEEAVRCQTCATAHHPTCFGEHGGCAVHGCGSEGGDSGPAPTLGWREQVRVGAAYGRQTDGRGAREHLAALRGELTCGRCAGDCRSELLVARCSVCGEVQHTGCYEQTAGCSSEACRLGGFPVTLTAPQHALWENQRLAGKAFRFMGLFFVPLALYVLTLGVQAGLAWKVALGLALLFPVVAGQLVLWRLRARDAEAPAETPARTLEVEGKSLEK